MMPRRGSIAEFLSRCKPCRGSTSFTGSNKKAALKSAVSIILRAMQGQSPCALAMLRRIAATHRGDDRIAKRKPIMSKTFHVLRRNHDQTGRESLMESAQWTT